MTITETKHKTYTETRIYTPKYPVAGLCIKIIKNGQTTILMSAWDEFIENVGKQGHWSEVARLN